MASAPTRRKLTPPASRPARGYVVVLATTAVVAALLLCALVLRPGAPRRVAIATGGPTSTFFRFGQAYQRILREQGVALEVNTQDANPTENVRRLEAPGSNVQVAIVHGGAIETEAEDPASDLAEIQKRHPDLVTLGTVFCEPVWVFHRLPGEPDRLSALVGRRIVIGRHGSTSNIVARLMLRTAGVDPASVTLLETKVSETPAALAKGEIDAVIVSAPLEARPIQELWKTPGVTLMSLSQAEAFTRRLPWMKQVTLPAGGLDIGRNVPPRDTLMLASGASLVARRSLHPGIVYLLMGAAVQVHGGASAFQRYGEFPSLGYVDLPVHDSARKYFKEGPSLLYRYLPFWLASILERIGVVLPLAAIVLSIARYAPPAYNWMIQARINRCYGELRYLEDDIDRAGPAGGGDFERRFQSIEARAASIAAPVSYSPQLYTLRWHIQLVRDKLKGSQGASPSR